MVCLKKGFVSVTMGTHLSDKGGVSEGRSLINVRVARDGFTQGVLGLCVCVVWACVRVMCGLKNVGR